MMKKHKREFLGIDKACAEKSNITRENYEKLKKKSKKGKNIYISWGIIILAFWILSLIFELIGNYIKGESDIKVLIVFLS